MWEIKHTIIVIVAVIVALVIGFFAGIYFSKSQFQKLQKKLESGNIDKEQLRMMSSAFGKKFSEEQLNRMMKEFESFRKKKPKKEKK